MASALDKDPTEVSIDEIRVELHKKLAEIQACHDELKFYVDCYTDHLPAREHAQKFSVKLQEIIDKMEEVKEFYGS